MAKRKIEKELIRAHIVDGGNTKLGKTIGTFSKLMGDEDYFIPELGMTVKGTCGHFCNGCKKHCYVRKSYVRHTCRADGTCSVKYGHAINTIAIYEDIHKAFADIKGQIKRKRKLWKYVRIDQSGELLPGEFLMWCDTAREAAERGLRFYLYSKAFEYMEEALLAGIVPENLTVLYSIWHEYGIAEFKRVMHLPNVKAFVYVDANRKADGWSKADYARYGIIITCMCPAYDIKGKMNHAITCDKCEFCMNRRAGCKIIGCFDH